MAFFRGTHRSPVDSPHKGQQRGALIFYNVRMNKRMNGRDSVDFRRHGAHYDVIMIECECENDETQQPLGLFTPHQGPVSI